MRTRRTWILATAVVALVIAVFAMVIMTGQRSVMLRETDETLRSVKGSMTRLLPQTAASAEDRSLVAGMKRLARARYVAASWLVDTNGAVVFASGGPAQVGDNVFDLAPEDAVQLLKSQDASMVRTEDGLELLAAAAMRREGEHNDVFRNTVRTVTDSSGRPTGAVIVAYDVNPSVSRPGLRVLLPTLVVFACFLVYWLGLVAWVYLDAKDRGEAATLWAVYVFFTNLMGMLAYLIAIAKPRTRVE